MLFAESLTWPGAVVGVAMSLAIVGVAWAAAYWDKNNRDNRK